MLGFTSTETHLRFAVMVEAKVMLKVTQVVQVMVKVIVTHMTHLST